MVSYAKVQSTFDTITMFIIQRIKKVRKRKFSWVIFPFLILAFFVFYVDRVYPGIKVAGIDIGGRQETEVLEILKGSSVPLQELHLIYKQSVYKIPGSEIDLNYDYTKTFDRAYKVGRSGNWLFDIGQIVSSVIKTKNLGFAVNLNEEKLTSYLSTIAGQITSDPVYPSVKLVGKEVVVDNGKPGNDLDLLKLRALIAEHLAFQNSTDIEIPITPVDPSLDEKSYDELKKKAEGLVGKKVTIKFESQSLVLADKDIIALLSPNGSYKDEEINKIIEKVKLEFEREPRDAKFEFLTSENNGEGKVNEFEPAQNGARIKTDEFRLSLVSALESLNSDQKEITLEVPTILQKPQINTADVNNFGIKELIGHGQSIFFGSIASRVHNIGIAANKINGTMIAPGETFSFNETVGDISVFTGYQQAYIISGGKTVLGDGGGVCQVSTTIFRAAMNAGLPIVERNAHAYRVHYYEEDALPGLDATIYSPTVDLKFKNDTPAYILIQTHFNPAKYFLSFDFYGTSDGRVATVSKPILSDYVPAPTPLYTDDPTLPLGTVKQVDFSAPGTKSRFTYTVTRSGETLINQTFYSNYRAWQAKFLRGTNI